VTRRTRIFVGILFAYALGVGWLMFNLLRDIDPRYRESAEESLVETAHLIATLVEQQSGDGTLRAEPLRPAMRALYSRSFKATIFGFEKTGVELRVAVVDATGRVVFDSIGRHEGEDWSQWRDVRRALQGEYGARATPDIEGDPQSTVMYVAAPVMLDGRIAGAVSVGKPVASLGDFVAVARRKTMTVGLTSVAAAAGLALILSVWLVRPFGLIADYVRFVRRQRSFSLPRLGRRALGTLGAAYDEMRDALAGRNYVNDYVQTLTHELKSPLSAIRGAAELLHEPAMPAADRERFVANIERETRRIEELVDRLSELAELESRRRLLTTEPVALRPMLEELVASAQARGAARAVGVTLAVNEHGWGAPWVEGDAFLLRRAVRNLLDNALDFSPDGTSVRVEAESASRSIELRVVDRGPGIPGYADDKVFEKFYSLARPHSQKKSTGLGLAFVKEIAELHHGRIGLVNGAGGGAVATLSLPRAEPPDAA
jgi:two-component system sensor histidine kinase CreC